VAQSKLPYVTLNIEEELLKRIEDFRFKNRFQSRAATMKWLMTRALDQKPKPPVEN
jgi:hypothetical protein